MKLLQLLEQDCTLTPEQLASMADMSVEDVKAEIKRYEDEKLFWATRPSWTGTAPTGRRLPP